MQANFFSILSSYDTNTPFDPYLPQGFCRIENCWRKGLRNVFENQQQKWGGRGFSTHFDLQIDRILLLLLLLEWWWWWNGGKMEQLHHNVKNECLLLSLSLSKSMIWSRKQAASREESWIHEPWIPSCNGIHNTPKKKGWCTSMKFRVAFLSVGRARFPTKHLASMLRFSYLTCSVGSFIPTLQQQKFQRQQKSNPNTPTSSKSIISCTLFMHCCKSVCVCVCGDGLWGVDIRVLGTCQFDGGASRESARCLHQRLWEDCRWCADAPRSQCGARPLPRGPLCCPGISARCWCAGGRRWATSPALPTWELPRRRRSHDDPQLLPFWTERSSDERTS